MKKGDYSKEKGAKKKAKIGPLVYSTPLKGKVHNKFIKGKRKQYKGSRSKEMKTRKTFDQMSPM